MGENDRAKRILIVEDERIVAMDLRALLEELGYQVVAIAASCDEALAKAAVSPPDLALMDVQIKGNNDGIQTASLLRARHRIPIVYLTANADQATLTRALETEPGGFLAKPYDARTLRTTIEVALRRHDAEVVRREAHDAERRRFEESAGELIKLAERLREQANVDPLTGLFNRRYMEEALREFLSRAEHERRPLGLILVDLDEFKKLNDSFGHVAGDKVLIALASLLRNDLRVHDIACRYGGEEILVMAPGASLGEAVALAERLRGKLGQLPIEVDGTNVVATASFGVSAFPEHGFSAERLIRAADSALYAAKSRGRNCVVAAPI